MKNIKFKKGSGLVEILVAIFIFSIILGSLITISNTYLSNSGENLKIARGAYLAEEGIEALKTMRDKDWANVTALNTGTNYYLYFDTSSSTNYMWKATTTASVIDSIFKRTFTLSAVYRDSNGRIQQSGTLDANTKLVSVSVSWPTKNATTTKSLSTYIADIL
jgi:Tfp pilus assembly protein PilV